MTRPTLVCVVVQASCDGVRHLSEEEVRAMMTRLNLAPPGSSSGKRKAKKGSLLKRGVKALFSCFSISDAAVDVEHSGAGWASIHPAVLQQPPWMTLASTTVHHYPAAAPLTMKAPAAPVVAEVQVADQVVRAERLLDATPTPAAAAATVTVAAAAAVSAALEEDDSRSRALPAALKPQPPRPVPIMTPPPSPPPPASPTPCTPTAHTESSPFAMKPAFVNDADADRVEAEGYIAAASDLEAVCSHALSPRQSEPSTPDSGDSNLSPVTSDCDDSEDEAAHFTVLSPPAACVAAPKPSLCLETGAVSMSASCCSCSAQLAEHGVVAASREAVSDAAPREHSAAFECAKPTAAQAELKETEGSPVVAARVLPTESCTYLASHFFEALCKDGAGSGRDVPAAVPQLAKPEPEACADAPAAPGMDLVDEGVRGAAAVPAAAAAEQAGTDAAADVAAELRASACNKPRSFFVRHSDSGSSASSEAPVAQLPASFPLDVGSDWEGSEADPRERGGQAPVASYALSVGSDYESDPESA